ncbi:transcription antitermination factor NusB [Parvularcula dongshanensis]|uniref:Transcription antitermination protein NusB n=1 Tax=Parvularcula dongshanensis TaxID=1173995 RepID=A0A840I0G8_9PROT|nr:transcription antitermination factor NusB [Parvularcula dongshanensis]MBB4657702.1 N utilization substance protein B [Parvularcula dongshanensis]
MTEAARDGYTQNVHDARTLARLAAVQALYQMEHSGQGVDGVIREYQEHRLGGELDGQAIRDADDEFFSELVRGVVETQRRIDPYIQRRLREGWTLKRLDAIARAILRCGVFELVRRPDVPAGATVSEYVEIAASFFGEGETETKFVNGVLDGAAKDVRADEER